MTDLDSEQMEKPIAKAVPEKYEQFKRIDELEDKVRELQKELDGSNTLIVEAFEFLGNHVRPIFGMGDFAVACDAIVKRYRGQ